MSVKIDLNQTFVKENAHFIIAFLSVFDFTTPSFGNTGKANKFQWNIF